MESKGGRSVTRLNEVVTPTGAEPIQAPERETVSFEPYWNVIVILDSSASLLVRENAVGDEDIWKIIPAIRTVSEMVLVPVRLVAITLKINSPVEASPLVSKSILDVNEPFPDSVLISTDIPVGVIPLHSFVKVIASSSP